MALESGSWDAAIPPALGAAIEAELRPDETVIWVGRPGDKLPPFDGEAWFRMFVFFALALVGTVVALVTDGWVRTVAVIIAAVSGFIFVGGLLLPWLWRLGVVQRYCCYLLTDRRVLICYRRPTAARPTVQSFLPADLGRMACEEREDGSGDLVFDADAPTPVSSRDGFIGIDRVREVDTLIRTTLRLT